MDPTKALPYILPFVRARWLGGHLPLVVGIQITTRCNLQCDYCTRWRGPPEDLQPGLVRDLFRELRVLGTRRVVLTGGEPLVRSDLGTIVGEAAAAGLRVGVNTNGTLVSRRIEDLDGVAEASMSLDGVGEAHDRLRGPGTFEKVMEGAEALRSRGVRVRYTVVLHRGAIGEVDRLLALGRKQGIPILFQPLFDPASDAPSHRPDEGEYRQTIDNLISVKRNSLAGVVANSVTGLRYLRGWPRLRWEPCAGGRVFCRVQANGDVVICAEHARAAGNVVAEGARVIGDAFRRLATGECGTCPCANHVEINQSFRLRPEAVLNLVRLL